MENARKLSQNSNNMFMIINLIYLWHLINVVFNLIHLGLFKIQSIKNIEYIVISFGKFFNFFYMKYVK